MAISPLSDIVLDVARAAEAGALQAAQARLSGGVAAATGGFSVAARADPKGPAAPRAGERADPLQKFEAMVLQTFIENMLPDKAENVYGGGVAGDMWKSMMAQQLAETMAAQGGIGIARGMLRDHYVQDEKVLPVGAVSDPAASAATGNQDRLSAALVQEMQRKLARSLGEDAATRTGATSGM